MPSDLNSHRIFMRLKSFPLFNELGTNDLRSILLNCRLERWPKRSLVVTKRAAEGRFYVLINGRIKIEAQNPENGKAITLSILNPGDGYSLTSLLGGKVHEAQAEALDTVEMLSAPIDEWREWLDMYAPLRNAVVRSVIERLYEVTELAQSLALHDTSTRLAHLLLRQMADAGREMEFFDDMVHEDLGSLIGTVRVVVNRLINQFKREGILATDERGIRVIDAERLRLKAERGPRVSSTGAQVQRTSAGRKPRGAPEEQ